IFEEAVLRFRVQCQRRQRHVSEILGQRSSVSANQSGQAVAEEVHAIAGGDAAQLFQYRADDMIEVRGGKAGTPLELAKLNYEFGDHFPAGCAAKGISPVDQIWSHVPASAVSPVQGTRPRRAGSPELSLPSALRSLVPELVPTVEPERAGRPD